MHKTDQEGLKYQKLYNWAHTLITSGIIKNMDKFPSETSLQKKFGVFQTDREDCIATARGRRSDYPCEGKRNLCFLRQQWSKWRKTTDRSSSELLF